VHLAGPTDADRIRRAAAEAGVNAVVHSFFADMEIALGAATVAVSRAGASSLAELAAMRVPAVLVPFPAATDDHQFYNAQAFAETGAARLLPQRDATPEKLVDLILPLARAGREQVQVALAEWDRPRAAEQIAETILTNLCRSADSQVPAVRDMGKRCDCDSDVTKENRLSTYECHP
jgi:UDP-N-acetylglucosamine--N-acetylmuramyl-(pentapeptide) pyrophosphoryl-undecaprenol N-acetylglucosamine transferase